MTGFSKTLIIAAAAILAAWIVVTVAGPQSARQRTAAEGQQVKAEIFTVSASADGIQLESDWAPSQEVIGGSVAVAQLGRRPITARPRGTTIPAQMLTQYSSTLADGGRADITIEEMR